MDEIRDQSLGEWQLELTKRERGHIDEQHLSACKVEDGDADRGKKRATLA
jgi:hypothetical protein